MTYATNAIMTQSLHIIGCFVCKIFDNIPDSDHRGGRDCQHLQVRAGPEQDHRGGARPGGGGGGMS